VRGFAVEALTPMLEERDVQALRSRLARETSPFVRGKIEAAVVTALRR
jgi:hypothetical protein